MGRKNKSKKKAAEGDGGPPPPPPPPPKPKKKKEKDGSTRTYLKIKAVFKCSGDKCSKTWSSVHAWERDEQFYCDLCGEKAEVVTFKDEMCELANYDCEGASCGGNHWQSIADGGRTENCDLCGRGVQPNGTQIRFGRHFWFACTSSQCGEGWEDFSLTPQRTQRCSKCRSRGDIIGTKKIQESDDIGGKADGGGRRGAMAHNWENCDMCVDLKGQGKAQTCLKFRKVHCRVIHLDDGVYAERITGVQ